MGSDGIVHVSYSFFRMSAGAPPGSGFSLHSSTVSIIFAIMSLGPHNLFFVFQGSLNVSSAVLFVSFHFLCTSEKGECIRLGKEPSFMVSDMIERVSAYWVPTRPLIGFLLGLLLGSY
jgi:hypothetical protein